MLLRNSAIYLVARVIPSLLGVVGIAIYTRLLDPAGYGVFALVFGAAGLAQVWLFEWLRLATLHYRQRYHRRRTAFSSTIATATVAMAALLTPLAAMVALLGLAPPGEIIGGAALALMLGLFGVAGATALADLAPLRFTTMKLLQVVLMLALSVPPLLLGAGPLALVGALALATAVAIVPVLLREWPQVDWRATSRVILRRCWRYGLPLSLSSGFGVVVLSSDRFCSTPAPPEATPPSA